MKSEIVIERIGYKHGAEFKLYVNGKEAGKVTYSGNWIDDLGIYNRYQRKGYARLLLNVVLSEFGNNDIRLIAAGDDRYCPTKELVKFYRSLGFRGHKVSNHGEVRMFRIGGMLKKYKFKL